MKSQFEFKRAGPLALEAPFALTHSMQALLSWEASPALVGARAKRISIDSR